MKRHDHHGNHMTFFQDRAGRIRLAFGNVDIYLYKEQVEALLGPNVYDIENFDKEAYLQMYGDGFQQAAQSPPKEEEMQ